MGDKCLAAVDQGCAQLGHLGLGAASGAVQGADAVAGHLAPTQSAVAQIQHQVVQTDRRESPQHRVDRGPLVRDEQRALAVGS